MNLQTIKTEHPTGGINALLTALATVIIWVSSLFGDLGVTEAVASSIAVLLVSIPTLIVSRKTPRFDAAQELVNNVPENDNTGPG